MSARFSYFFILSLLFRAMSLSAMQINEQDLSCYEELKPDSPGYLFGAIATGNTEGIIDWLGRGLSLELEEFDCYDSTTKTPLFKAIEVGNTQLVQCFIMQGADPNHQVSTVWPLCRAYDNNSLTIFHLLLQHKDIQIMPAGRVVEPFHYITMRDEDMSGHFKVVARLVYRLYKKGLKPGKTAKQVRALLNGKDAYGNAALHALCRLESLNTLFCPLLTVLLGMGADPNIQNNKGDTALHAHQAAYEKDSTYLFYLLNSAFFLRYGARIDIANNAGNVPVITRTKEEEKELKKHKKTLECLHRSLSMTFDGVRPSLGKIGVEDKVLDSDEFATWVGKVAEKLTKHVKKRIESSKARQAFFDEIGHCAEKKIYRTELCDQFYILWGPGRPAPDPFNTTAYQGADSPTNNLKYSTLKNFIINGYPKKEKLIKKLNQLFDAVAKGDAQNFEDQFPNEVASKYCSPVLGARNKAGNGLLHEIALKLKTEKKKKKAYRRMLQCCVVRCHNWDLKNGEGKTIKELMPKKEYAKLEKYNEQHQQQNSW